MKKANKLNKVIIDTNIWISFLIGKHLKGLQYYIDSKKVIIVTCHEQFQELNDVFKKPKIRKYISVKQKNEFLDLLVEVSEMIILQTATELCRDPKDNYLISLAIDSCSDFLITGDNDLLELGKVGNTRIIKYTDFDKIISK